MMDGFLHSFHWDILNSATIMTGTFKSVSIVDYSRLENPATKQDELLKLREAIFVVGFLYLTNTGLEVRTYD